MQTSLRLWYYCKNKMLHFCISFLNAIATRTFIFGLCVYPGLLVCEKPTSIVDKDEVKISKLILMPTRVCLFDLILMSHQ